MCVKYWWIDFNQCRHQSKWRTKRKRLSLISMLNFCVYLKKKKRKKNLKFTLLILLFSAMPRLNQTAIHTICSIILVHSHLTSCKQAKRSSFILHFQPGEPTNRPTDSQSQFHAMKNWIELNSLSVAPIGIMDEYRNRNKWRVRCTYLKETFSFQRLIKDCCLLNSQYLFNAHCSQSHIYYY